MSKRQPFSVTMMTHGRCVIEHGTIPDKPAVRTAIRLPGSILDALRKEAKRRGISTDELAVSILQVVAGDDLFAAVLGEPGTPQQKLDARRV